VPEHLNVVGPKLFLSVVGAKLSFEAKSSRVTVGCASGSHAAAMIGGHQSFVSVMQLGVMTTP
jgi:hypothetical protein